MKKQSRSMPGGGPVAPGSYDVGDQIPSKATDVWFDGRELHNAYPVLQLALRGEIL
jgi:hypothetical protein